MLEWKIGDCQDLMSEMEPDSVDLVVTDPPYGISMMNKGWDKVVPSVDLWQEALRVLKPGAFAFIMSAPRQDVLAHNLVNLSDAGFETGFTSIYWVYPSGFPKASNIGKMVDKRLEADREVVGKKIRVGDKKHYPKNQNNDWVTMGIFAGDSDGGQDITVPATPEAKLLDGSYGGFQPKPAVEIIMVVMKPLSEKTYVDQALANGKGITWLDDGRIPFNAKNEPNLRLNAKNHITTKTAGIECFNKIGDDDRSHSTDRSDFLQDLGFHNTQGRFPANLLVSDDVLNDGTTRSSCKSSVDHSEYGDEFKFGGGVSNPTNQYGDSGSFSRYFDLDAWFDTKYLPKEVQRTFPFLITPKASKSEKNKGQSGTKKTGGSMSGNQGKTMDLGAASLKDDHKQIQPSINTHPTVKPVKLFSWLMTIGSRKDDLVLDPFLGSGTALEAGYLTGRNVIGMELDPQWEKLYAAHAHTHQGSLEDWF